MASEPTRSEQVVADYKQRKLGLSALRRIHELIQGFEDDRQRFDTDLARLLGNDEAMFVVADDDGRRMIQAIKA